MTRRVLPLLCGVLLLAIALPVYGGTVSGRLLDEVGKPVAGAKVTWEPFRSDQERLLDGTRGADPKALGEIATDVDGRFRVTLDKTGSLTSIRIMPAGPSAFVEGPFEASETRELEEIQLPAVDKVSGRVLDEAGKPVPGARVRLAEMDFLESETRFYADTVTGADGAFSFAAPEEARDLSVRAPGFVPFRRTRLDRKAAAEKVTLKRGGSIRGTVVDAAGQPAAGAIVLTGDLAVEADAAGAYKLTGVPAGTPSVEASWKQDFIARKDSLRVRKGEEIELPLRLSRASSITGTVIDEKARRPVGGVVVRAASAGPVMRFAGFNDVLSRRARSDARGRFRITGLTPRRYTVEAARDGYLPASISGVVAETQGRASVSLALARAASVSGRVTTEDGKPVPGVRVRLLRDRGPIAMLNTRNPAAAMFGLEGVRTKPDGTYRLKQLYPSRSASLEALKDGFAPAKKHGVALKGGEMSRDVNLMLQKGLEARGRVVNATGEPVAGADVHVSPAERMANMGISIVSRMGRRERPDAITSRDGGFTVSGLEEGEVSVRVAKEGYAEKTFSGLSIQSKEPNQWPPFALSGGVSIGGFVRDAQGSPIVGATVTAFGEAGGSKESTSDLDGSFHLDGFQPDRVVRLSARADGYGWLQRSVTPPSEGLVLTLKAAGIVRGRVEDGDTKRAVTDFSVACVPKRTGGLQIRFGGPADKTFQSADGSFELTDVAPGKWTVRASAPGYRAAEVGEVEVAEGETKEGILLSLKRGEALSGRVLDPRRGTGVANASVSWQEPNPDEPNRLVASVVSRMMGTDNTTTTDADGRFQFDGLPTGRIAVTASHEDFLDATKEVEADADTQVDITLSVGGAIAGMVIGKDGRTPVAGAEVSLSALGDASTGWGGETGPSRADAAGNFLFEHLRSGRYRVSADSPAGKAPPKEVILGENQRLDGVLLTLTGGTAVRGTVSGLPAGSLGGIRIMASARDYNDTTATDEAGRFTLRDVPGGSLRISARSGMMSGRSTSKSFEVPEGAAEFAVDVVFEGTSRLSGRITRADRPLAGVFVNASPDPPSPTGGRASAQTDEDGRYALEGLADGRYQVFLGGSGVSYRKVLEVSGDTSGDIALPAVTLSGVVTEASSGSPLEGVTVRAETGRETMAFTFRGAVTDSRGYYSLEDLDPGTYKVMARKDGYQAKEQSVSIGSSHSDLNLALSRGSGLAIRAMDGQTGLPLRGVTVSAFAGSSVAFTGSVPLDSEGKGELSSLAPGTYSVYMFSQGYAPRVFAGVAVPSPLLSIALTPGGRVEVRSDAPVTGRIVDTSGHTYMINPWRTDGRVNPAPPLTVWENFAPGSYQLIVSSSSGEKAYPFTVAEGRTTTVEVR